MGWDKAEERMYNNNEILKILIEGLLYDNKTNEAMSIIKRHSILSSDFSNRPYTLEKI